jgi:hypothetical protein
LDSQQEEEDLDVKAKPSSDSTLTNGNPRHPLRMKEVSLFEIEEVKGHEAILPVTAGSGRGRQRQPQ